MNFPLPSPSSASGDASDVEPAPAADMVSALLETARSQLGKIYRWGGSSPEEGFDCSGFVKWVFSQHGFQLPRSSREQIASGIRVEPSQLRPGDLVFFSRAVGSGQPHHVGIYAGGGRFIHSPSSGRRIQFSGVGERYFASRFLGGRRVLPAPAAVSAAVADSATAAISGEDMAIVEEDPAPRVYVVVTGDSIWKIARKFGVSPHTILKINRLNVADIIHPGLRLVIP